ncbi:MAG TPA: hypothetical protein DCQ64_32305 [Candidatus Rokubacteria bacterium]|nr:hypothetical protein [Candidatus Rokubacteria bacterium]
MARNRNTGIKVVTASLALLAALALGPSSSTADGVKIIVPGGAWPGATSGWRRGHPAGQTKVIVTDPRARVIVTGPNTRVIVAPRSYYYAPSYVAPVYPRWMPGYWTYQWVPRVSTSYVYVPGFYTAEGLWVESHYQPQMIQTGYYQQPVWVEGYWAR